MNLFTMDTLKELGVVTFRVITIFPLVLGITLFIGKRSIASMSVFDYLIIIALGAIIGADLADPNIPHIHTAYTLIIVGLLQKYVAVWVVKKRKFGSLITFEPTVVIRNGHFQNKNLKRIHYTIDNVLQMLRDKGIFEINQVELGIIEANGSLSVQKTAEQRPLTPSDVGIQSTQTSISVPVVLEGKIDEKALSHMKLTPDWLKTQLNLLGIDDLDKVFYASINNHQELHVSPKISGDSDQYTVPH